MCLRIAEKNQFDQPKKVVFENLTHTRKFYTLACLPQLAGLLEEGDIGMEIAIFQIAIERKIFFYKNCNEKLKRRENVQ